MELGELNTLIASAVSEHLGKGCNGSLAMLGVVDGPRTFSVVVALCVDGETIHLDEKFLDSIQGSMVCWNRGGVYLYYHRIEKKVFLPMQLIQTLRDAIKQAII